MCTDRCCTPIKVRSRAYLDFVAGPRLSASATAVARLVVVVAAGCRQCFRRCCGRRLLLVASALRPCGHTLVAFSWHRCVWQCVVVPPFTPRCTCCAPSRVLASRTMHGASTNEPHPGEHTTRSEPFYLIPWSPWGHGDYRPRLLRERGTDTHTAQRQATHVRLPPSSAVDATQVDKF